ncbi:MAG: methyltransferase domain-containing protein [Spirochaetota bacterium]|nr:methyltransferase domain-containing protein [Spirochaetota bacterium]
MSKAKENFLISLKKEGINKKIIDAYSKFEQKDFFDSIFKNNFYTNETIPICNNETSDPPFSLAKMISCLSLKNNSRVLEIGTGSGYSTAIISSLVKEVVTIDYNQELSASAKKRLTKLNIDNVRFFTGELISFEGDLGYFDAMIILAACNQRPFHLMEYLKDGGIMVFPMGPIFQQQITVIINKIIDENENSYDITFKDFCCFPPLKGMYGQSQLL